MALATSNKRKLWFGALLLLTVLAAAWPVPDREPASPKTGERITSSQRHSQAAAVNVAFAPLRTTAPSKHTIIGDLFPSQTWTPPPAASVVQQPPAAPPLPFTFGGRYTEGNTVTIFLMEGNQMHRVRQGETVNGAYRVEKIDQASISLTYLPLGTTQILSTGVLLP